MFIYIFYFVFVNFLKSGQKIKMKYFNSPNTKVKEVVWNQYGHLYIYFDLDNSLSVKISM